MVSECVNFDARRQMEETAQSTFVSLLIALGNVLDHNLCVQSTHKYVGICARRYDILMKYTHDGKNKWHCVEIISSPMGLVKILVDMLYIWRQNHGLAVSGSQTQRRHT